MAKADPRERPERTGPVRTSSGTRVAAVRLTPLDPSVSPRRGANDFNDMPTRELDQAQLRAMALRCASDVGAGAGEGARSAALAPATEKPSRRRLQLVLTEDEAPLAAVEDDLLDSELGRSRRYGGLAVVVVVVVFAMAAVAAYGLYGLTP